MATSQPGPPLGNRRKTQTTTTDVVRQALTVGWNRNDGNLDQAWTLTPVGDWDLFTEEAVTQDRSHGPAHEIIDVTIGANTNSVQHDVKGNVTFIPAILRGSGISDDMTLWGKRGRGSFVRSTRRAVPANDPRPLFPDRLASADTDNGGTADVTFGYDALGRRVRKTTATLDTVFVQAGQQVIADYTAGAAPTSPREKYVYASYIDEPILKDGTLASGTGIVYYHRNQQYSVTALTDASGSVIERYAYDPHGALTILDGSGTPLTNQQSPISNRITYTGRELDGETNLYHFRARLYSPTLGRFLTRDPLGYVDGMSLYRGYFVLNGLDPSGTQDDAKSDFEALFKCLMKVDGEPVEQEHITDKYGNVRLNATGWVDVRRGLSYVEVVAYAYASASWYDIWSQYRDFDTGLVRSTGKAWCVYSHGKCDIKFTAGKKRGPKNISRFWLLWGTVRLAAFAYVPAQKAGDTVIFDPVFMAGYGGSIKIKSVVEAGVGGKKAKVGVSVEWEGESKVNDSLSGGNQISARCLCLETQENY